MFTTTRQIFIITAILVLGLAAMSWAHGGWGNGYHMGNNGNGYNMMGNGYNMMGNGHGPQMMYGLDNLTPEQQTKFEAIMDEQHDSMFAAGRDLNAKQMQLDALVRSGKAEKSDITTLTEEISTLRKGMYEQMNTFHERVEKEVGVDMPEYVTGNGCPVFGSSW